MVGLLNNIALRWEGCHGFTVISTTCEKLIFLMKLKKTIKILFPANHSGQPWSLQESAFITSR